MTKLLPIIIVVFSAVSFLSGCAQTPPGTQPLPADDIPANTASASATPVAGNDGNAANTQSGTSAEDDYWTDPPLSEFEYIYDATLGGAVVTKWNGDSTLRISLRVPGEIDGHKVVGLDGAFMHDYMTEIYIPDTVKYIGTMTFYGCIYLTSVVIPGSVELIDEWAFGDCVRLTGVALSDGVVAINDWAFAGCTALVNVTIPDSLTTIGEGAFSECTSLGDSAKKRILEINPTAMVDY